VIHTVEEVTGRPVVVEHLPPKPEPKILMSDSSRIRAELSWLPQQSGLAEMIRDGWQSMRDMTTLP
jgi:UDP-glucose 4-epimerase